METDRLETTQDSPTTLLDQLDRRQNEVLQELDALNERIEATLKSWTDQRSEPGDVSAAPALTADQ